VEFIQQGTTVMSQVHREALKKLCRAIQNKGRGMPTSGVVILHNNACLHIAAST
jgi:hypothetical protein